MAMISWSLKTYGGNWWLHKMYCSAEQNMAIYNLPMAKSIRNVLTFYDFNL